MRITVLALLVALGIVVSALPSLGVALPEEAVWGGRALALLAALWLAAEGLLAQRAQTRLKLLATKAEQDEIATLQAALREAHIKQSELETSLQEAQNALNAAQAKQRELETSLQDAREALARAGDEEVVSLLGLLQQKGRFLDFLMDDITKYPDAQVGAAARVVHQGCSAVVREYLDIKPVHDGGEGTPLTLTQDFDAHRYRLVGRVTGEPPFRGRVLHRGWLAANVKLPERIDRKANGGIIAPAEVELQ